MSDWLTITVHNSGLKQRVRKSAITVYGTDKGVAYVVRGNTLLQVRESESELRAELEGKPE